ncbi:MAG: FG-GAP-like repeat-containing protein [Flavobacteriales bacterium]|nr:FG-GAP-like repeat-containing protein [Flavobacteriales bacterium]
MNSLFRKLFAWRKQPAEVLQPINVVKATPLFLLTFFFPLLLQAQWLDWSEETDTRLVLTSVANSDDEEKDFSQADLNNDGWMDVIVVRKEPFSLPNEPAKSDLLLMNENGVLVDRTAMYAPEFISKISFARDVFIGDFDNDGWEDVIIANTFEQNPSYYRNLGNDLGGNWLGLVDESASRFPSTYDNTILICAVWGGDLTGNGFMDIYFVNYRVNGGGGTAEDFLLINDGTGVFTEEAASRLGNFRNSAFGTAVQIHDFDQDGDNDVLKVTTLYSVAPWGGTGTILMFNDGTGNFPTYQNLTPSAAPYMFDIADFDLDGDLDFYVVDDGSDYMLRTETITPDVGITFSTVGIPGTSDNGFGGNVHIADLDNDGDMDIAVADVDVDIPPCDSGRRLAIYENDNGSFTDPYGTTSYDWVDNSYDFGFLDINNDGLTDFLTGGCFGYGLYMSDNCDLVLSSADFDNDGLPDACDECPTNPDPNCSPAVDYPIIPTTHNVARQWNEMLLASIRMDFARPTVHARNLFHTSSGMWDAWSAYEEGNCAFLLGQTVDGFSCAFTGIPDPADVQLARDESISFMAYRLLSHRFAGSPEAALLQQAYDEHMATLGYDITNVSQDYASGDAAALGNYIAQCYIDFGLQDGANEQADYGNNFYAPVNPPLSVDGKGNPDIIDFNSWQPLTLQIFIDQSGNEIPGSTPDFLSPEWGGVTPFSLNTDDMVLNQRDGNDYPVYHDAGAPPLHSMDGSGDTDLYRWGFVTTALWSSHLDASDGVMWDISPNSIGNRTLPDTFNDYASFYDQLEGGTQSAGHTTNPATGAPYAVNMVARADYARVLAEFWADGPDSETPPGHWFTICNYVADHPDVEKRFMGEGPVLDDMEWDVKMYFMMGGAMHDCAVTAWGHKGWYDYLRPISAIRGMADLGQSTDPAGLNYHPGGLPLIAGKIEIVMSGDALAGDSDENVGKIKMMAWRGHKVINNVDTDEAGVDWILAEDWVPYQRPSFVTPPFAGYVSGHSTFSRAAAEVLTMFTGDEFFPGGMGVFTATQDDFLVFEDGPSATIELQWATYYDAADESGLSRIWGGIHPPCDDIPGRKMGAVIGVDAFDYAQSYFNDTDGDGTCDAFDPVCTGDLNGDGERNIADMLILLGDFGCTGPDCVADMDKDGLVGASDMISFFLPNFGLPCD